MVRLEPVSGKFDFSPLEDGSNRITVGEDGGRLEVTESLDFTGSQYIVMEVTNLNKEQLEIHFELYGGPISKEQPTFTCVLGAVPANRVRMYFDLKYLTNQEIFLPRTPGKLKTLVSGRTIRKEDIKAFAISFRENYKSQELILHNLYLSKERPDCTIDNPIMLADEFGQLKIVDWPGKTKSAGELTEYMKNTLFSVKPDGYDPVYRFSRYGGFIGKKFEGTGFFRVQQDEDRWWLADPEGYAFFSTGFDCVGTNSSGRVDGIESLYEWLPEETGEYGEAYSVRKGGGFQEGKFIDFYVVNLIRAFGTGWWEAWAKITKSRLYEWGFNTIGNWSQQRFIRWAKLPYVYPLADFPSTGKKIFRDFPDVFSDEYRMSSASYAKQLDELRDDPYLIGYFMRNEPIWAFAGHINLAREMFRDNIPFKTKDVLIDFLGRKYENNINSLNDAWNTALTDFNGVREMTYEQLEGRADEDLFEFSAHMSREYIRVPAEELRKVDGNHLNLGMRYAWISSELVLKGSEYYDVFSINCYKLKPDSDEIRSIYDKTGKPCMIGEYHAGAPDRGLLGAGLRSVLTQEERGKAYRYYTEQAAAIKELLGVHYFTLNDEPTLGRSDGEAWQIGAVDVCQRTYDEFVEGIREAHRNLYAVAAGEKEPYCQPPVEIPRIAY